MKNLSILSIKIGFFRDCFHKEEMKLMKFIFFSGTRAELSTTLGIRRTAEEPVLLHPAAAAATAVPVVSVEQRQRAPPAPAARAVALLPAAAVRVVEDVKVLAVLFKVHPYVRTRSEPRRR